MSWVEGVEGEPMDVGYTAPKNAGVPNASRRGTKSEVAQQVGGLATSPLPSRGSPTLHGGGQNQKWHNKWAVWLHHPCRLGGPQRFTAHPSSLLHPITISQQAHIIFLFAILSLYIFRAPLGVVEILPARHTWSQVVITPMSHTPCKFGLEWGIKSEVAHKWAGPYAALHSAGAPI